MDVVGNAADFIRQYKVRLDKVADIVFWKKSKRIRRKKLSQMQTKRTQKENWEMQIFDIICLLLTFCRNVLRE